MHFDMHGNVDRWGGRLEAAGVLLGFAVLTLGLERMMKRLLGRADVAAGTQVPGGGPRLHGAGLCVRDRATGGAGAGPGAAGSGPALDRPLGAGAGMGGSPGRGRIARQGRAQSVVGLRVYWTRSRLAWERANRMLGHIYFLGSLTGLALLPIVDEAHGYALLLAVVLGGALVATIESWRVWRADPERQA